MNLQKRDCPLEIELVPRGAGWTYVFLTTGGKRIEFVISNVLGDQFSDLVSVLYFFTPDQNDHDHSDNHIELVDGDFTVEEARKYMGEDARSMTTVRFSDIPSKAEFTWDEEGSFSRWTLERTPNLQSDFTVKLQIKTHCGENGEEYDFEFLYKDLCYAVAKAYTKALKEHGFYGYHFSTYHEKVCVHQLLFLKAVALDCLEVRKLTNHSSGHGEVTKLADEMELLMFDM